MTDPERERIAAAYRRFAEQEAHWRSPLYEELALSIATDREMIEFLATLPPAKRQPNLLLAAARSICGTARGWREFRVAVLGHAAAIRQVMLARTTQTNEPGRCAALLPVLSSLPQPLALLEVGASAGLCLLPDRYGYDYRGHVLRPAADGFAGPIFPCAIDQWTPVPQALPQVVWRAGLDLDPVNLGDPSDMAWLKALVWPEQTGRLRRLEQAMTVASANRPRVVAGDLRHDLVALAAEAPRDATLVIFHTAVLAYVADREERAEFARSVGTQCDFWIANEAAHVFREIATRAGDAASAGNPDPSGAPTGGGRFLLSVNGNPVAWTDPHGASLAWIAASPGGFASNRRIRS
ncbi:MAG TPA: DUF2332 domain-containing protein [Stellaceae bacterium]|nr:DUF2332 domain-containing protein [Stellaceae bacterium]